jgi:hypothetical protein
VYRLCLHDGTNRLATPGAVFPSGIRQVAPLGDLSMGVYTNDAQ